MARALNIMVILLVGFLLTMHDPILAQSLDEVTTLDKEVIQLYEQGHYSEAIPLAQQLLTIDEKSLVPTIPSSLNH